MRCEVHTVAKRQVGVLARTGALPQGKRSVEALARNGELPLVLHSKDKRETNNDYILDLLIQELAAAEGLSRLHLQALTERLLQQREEAAAQQDNSFEVPRKRDARTGYLVKGAAEPSELQRDLLDPEEFLGKNAEGLLTAQGLIVAADKKGGLASLAKHGYIGKRNDFADLGDDELDQLLQALEEEEGRDKKNIGAARNFLVGADKRHLAAARNFGDGKRNLAAFRNFASSEGKRNIGSARNFLVSPDDKRNIGAARNFLFSPDDKRNVGAARNFLVSNGPDDKRNIGALKNFISEDKRHVGSALRFLSPADKRNVGAARNFLLDEEKRNVGAARNFFMSGTKKNLGAARNFLYGKRNLASFARDGGFSNLKYPASKEMDWPWYDDDFDFDDFHVDEEKRNLGSLMRAQTGKRYLGSLRGKKNLASMRNFGKRFDEEVDLEMPKRYLGSFMRQGRPESDLAVKKREVNLTSEVTAAATGKSRSKRDVLMEEYPVPVYQNSRPPDYEELDDDEEERTQLEKRFLGLALHSELSPAASKRHIGALARLGWLPSFHSTRYSRSGRATNSRAVPFREDSTTWSCPSEDAGTIWSSSSATPAKLALEDSSRKPRGPRAPLLQSFHSQSDGFLPRSTSPFYYNSF